MLDVLEVRKQNHVLRLNLKKNLISVHELVGNCPKNLTILLSFCFRLPILRSTLVILQRRKKHFPKRNVPKSDFRREMQKMDMDYADAEKLVKTLLNDKKRVHGLSIPQEKQIAEFL